MTASNWNSHNEISGIEKKGNKLCVQANKDVHVCVSLNNQLKIISVFKDAFIYISIYKKNIYTL